PLLACAREVLATLGKAKEAAWAITVDDVREREKRYGETWLDGDGVIPAEAAEGDTRQAIADILSTQGPVPDRRGLPGVDEARITAFFAEIRQLAAWYAIADADPAIRPLGAATGAAWDAVAAVRAKIDDYFTRCRLAAFDPRAAALLMPSDAQLVALGARELEASDDEIAALPAALVEAGRPLPLGAGVNPAWAARVAAFAERAVTPLVGARAALAEDEW